VSATLPPSFDPWFQARCPEVPLEGARAVLDLASEGATPPFVARYRRDRTGGLDEPAVRRVLAAREHWDRILARQAIILESIERHATLDPALRERILGTFDSAELEDLYLPYRQKKKGRADAAREAGLSPLADWIWSCGHGTETPQEGQTLELWAFTFRDPEKGVPDARTAIEGARDILVERLAEDAGLRSIARRAYMEEGWLRATRTDKAKPNSRFESYFDFQEKVSSLLEPKAAARYLAVRRGQSEGELLLAVSGPPDGPELEERLLAAFEAKALSVPDSPGADVLRQAARIAFKGLVRNAVENDVHRVLKETADGAAAGQFAETVRRALLEAPLGRRPVLGIHRHRSACGLAAVDASGAVVASLSVQLQSDEERKAAGEAIVGLGREHAVEAVGVGNGAGGRAVELLARKALREAGLGDRLVVLVNEAGVGVYAASDAARAELPGLDGAARAAVSIARRLQDPLAELVRTEPKTLGVGQVHHDVAPAALHRALDAAVEGCVHEVGVDVGTASRHLLARVSGVTPGLATAIVEHREKEGAVRSRRQLMDVPGFGARPFEQAAGFLRVAGGENPLDRTRIHPERYAAVEACAARHGKDVGEILGAGAALAREDALLREALGPLTFEDAVRELEQPGRDPRPAFVPFAFREDVRQIDDLKPGMVCPGIVSNVTAFGAFVDVGAGQDGLVHVSQLGRKVAGDPREVIHPGERVQVRVLKVDLKKRQVSLSLRPAPPSRRPSARPRRPHPRAALASAGADANPPPAADGPPPPSRARPPSPARSGPRARPTSGPRSGARPSGASGSRPPGRPSGERRPERRPAFNNPFAVLADLKLDKRKG